MAKIITVDNLSYYHEKLKDFISSIEGGSADLSEYAKKTEVEDAINAAIYNALNTPI